MGLRLGVDPFAFLLVFVHYGVKGGFPGGTALLPPIVFVLSTIVKGTPVLAVNTGMRRQPPRACLCKPRPLLKNGSCQIGLTTSRGRIAKSEFPNPSIGVLGSG